MPTKPKPAASAEPPAGEPKLLSGGNPQIPKGDGEAPVMAYLAAMPGWKRDVGRCLDALVVRTVPQARKAVRWNTPFYGMEGRGWFFCFHCFNKYIKLTFLNGASLKAPPPITSKHPQVRYLQIHEGESVDEAKLADWFRQASALPGDECF